MMSALSESLVAAQRQAIAALSKSYVAGQMDAEPMSVILDTIGCADKVEQAQLLAALDTMRELGSAAPEAAKPDTSNEPASDAQMQYAQDLADKALTVLPDYDLTKANASKVIEQLKAGTYNPDEWTVPF